MKMKIRKMNTENKLKMNRRTKSKIGQKVEIKMKLKKLEGFRTSLPSGALHVHRSRGES
ncbi:hypothetical protein DSECCO2_458840 [anaerobic digester metagenome]|jgi:hypothetical protein